MGYGDAVTLGLALLRKIRPKAQLLQRGTVKIIQ
jgi:hypothetical protein